MIETAMTFPLFFSAIKNSSLPAERDGELFLSLLIPEKKRLYNFILKSMNYSEDAKDIYQESLLRAFRYFGKFDPGKAFRPWVFAIASNEIKKQFKKRTSLINVVSLDDLVEQLPGETDRQLAEAVFSVATSLRVVEREIFFLFYDSGFSVAEISSITGKSEGNIKVILSNSRKKIRAMMGETNDK